MMELLVRRGTTCILSVIPRAGFPANDYKLRSCTSFASPRGPTLSIRRSRWPLRTLHCAKKSCLFSSSSISFSPSSPRPLQGLRCLELCSVLAGPSVGQFLAELGCDVIKVENPKTEGDVTRRWKTQGSKCEPSSYFQGCNLGKRSISLDLKASEDYEIFHKLLRKSDIVLASYKTQAEVQRLRIDYETCVQAVELDELQGKINKCGRGTNPDHEELKSEQQEESFYSKPQHQHPGLIYGAITGYGGTTDQRAGYDACIQAEAGFMFLNRESVDTTPLKMPVALMDLLAAHQLKQAILVALYERQQMNNYGSRGRAAREEAEADSKLAGEGGASCKANPDESRNAPNLPRVLPHPPAAHHKFVEVSLLRSAVTALANQASAYVLEKKIPQPLGSDHPSIAPYGTVFYDKERKPFVLAVGTDAQFAKLYSEFLQEDQDDIVDDSGTDSTERTRSLYTEETATSSSPTTALPAAVVSTSPNRATTSLNVPEKWKTNVQRCADREALKRSLQQSFAQRDRQALLEKCGQLGIPAGAVNDLREVFEHSEAQKALVQIGENRYVSQVAWTEPAIRIWSENEEKNSRTEIGNAFQNNPGMITEFLLRPPTFSAGEHSAEIKAELVEEETSEVEVLATSDFC
ncbi:unnamed protein product [Amoebophrya sp. A120]|nr:unnamed protein product [Amoebophrya sp. A120]|eukprot:GSA120T00017720001.1